MSAPLEIASLSAIEHVLRHNPARVKRLFLPTNSGARAADLAKLAKAAKVPIDASPRGKHMEPVAALLHPFAYKDFRELRDEVAAAKHGFIVCLDHLQDPQNFGALCRTAEGLGATALVIPKDRGVTVSAGVYHASVGAVDTIPVALVNNLGEAVRQLKEAGFWAVGSSLGADSKPLAETPAFEKVALVLGTELEGMSSVLEKLCDWKVRIPLSGKVQSLNVSAAGAILMFALISRLPEKPSFQ